MAHISVSRIATTLLAPTHAVAMLATPSMLLDMAVMILMNVDLIVTSAPRIATTLWDPIFAAVEQDIDWMVTVDAVMVRVSLCLFLLLCK